MGRDTVVLKGHLSGGGTRLKEADYSTMAPTALASSA
jgi:hypothetical protein